MDEKNIADLVEDAPSHLDEVVKELPIDLVKNLPTIVSRLNAFITFYSALNLKRLSKLTEFVIKSEEILFDESSLLNQDLETIKDNYRQAKTASLEILDLARKVAIQIPQDESTNKEADEVYKLLKSLSPDSLSELKAKLLTLVDTKSDD